MKRYSVKVKEVLERIIEVEANSKEEALENVKNSYGSSDIVLDYEDLKEQKITLNKIKVGINIRIKNLFDCIEANYSITNEQYQFLEGDMDFLCGRVFEIVDIDIIDGKKFYMIKDEKNQSWYFTKKMFTVIE